MNKDFELTLLSEGQIWGNHEEEQLDVLKKYGTIVNISDLSIITGATVKNRLFINAREIELLNGRKGMAWTKTCNLQTGSVCINTVNGGHDYNSFNLHDGQSMVIRPVFQSSVIFSKIFSNSVRGYNDTYEVEYLEFPQWAAPFKMQLILNSSSKALRKTGNSYTFELPIYDSSEYKIYRELIDFSLVTYDEYEYQGKKYICVEVNSCYGESGFRLSNGVTYKNGDYVWVEVSPVKWLIDEKTQTLISKYGLLSGIRFLDKNHEYKGDFSRTEMYEYLNKYMIKDLFQSVNSIQKVSDNNIEESLNILGLDSCEGFSQEILSLVVKDRIDRLITNSDMLCDSNDYKLLKKQIDKILKAGNTISMFINNNSNKVKKLDRK